MHRISYIEIQNFRACQSVSLPLDDFTPLVRQNNVGKSTILESLRWLLKPDARSASVFADAKQPIVVTARIEGISAAILGLIPEPKHRTAIEPFCPNGVLWIRVSADGTTAKSLKPEVWNPAVVEANGKPKEWRPYPTGLPQSGCIEHVTGTADKGEEAIIEQEEALRTKSSADVAAEFPAIVECFNWIKSFDKPAQANAQP